MNSEVRVRLTDHGRLLLRQNHEKLFAHWDEPPKYTAKTEGRGGWSKWQLWVLMQEFGPHIYNGCKMPFKTEIDILEKVE